MFPKLAKLIEKMVEQFNFDLPLLFDNKTSMELNCTESLAHNQFIEKFEDSRVIIEFNINIEPKFSTKFYLLITYTDSVVYSGTILKETDKEIEKWSNASNLNEKYAEAFVLFCNKMAESFNTIFNNLIPENIKIQYSEHFITPKDNNMVQSILKDHEDQMIFAINTDIFLPKVNTSKISIFFQLELVESFFGETVYFSRNKAKGKILVVDDSKTDILIIRKQMRNSNYIIIEGKDERSALHHLFVQKVDLILLDIFLEKENGLSLCRRIRRNMLCDSIPVIMFSWGATKENVIKSLRAGAQDFLAKPFTKGILLKKIQKYIGKDDEFNLI